MGVKNCIKSNFKSDLENIQNIYFFIDQHTTATNGKYELEESLETEFKIGNYSADYNFYTMPITQNLRDLKLKFLDSKKNVLIRASDIIANYIFNLLKKEDFTRIQQMNRLSVYIHPN